MKNFRTFAVTLITLLFTASFFTSCSDSDSNDGITTYSMGFSQVSTSDTNSIGVIEAAYKSALGVSTTTFEWPGGVNDDAVRTKCAVAEKTLSSTTISGSYTFQITRGTTTVYTHSFGSTK